MELGNVGPFYLLNRFMQAEAEVILGAHYFCGQAHMLDALCHRLTMGGSNWGSLCKVDV